MKTVITSDRRGWIASSVLLLTVVLAGGALAAWKYASLKSSAKAAANPPEPMESVTAVLAEERELRRTTTSIGTILALRSVTLRNEMPGTVREAALEPGKIVEPGELLVALDVSVENAELKAQEAQAALAETLLGRMQRLIQSGATSAAEVDRARSERDVALAQIARTKAIIARKTIRAPFRARVGISDVHPGQYLQEGTLLTTLQGVEGAVHVDFTVTQQAASFLREGDGVDIFTVKETVPIRAKVVALDSRIDPATRNAMVRARIEGADRAPAPGASVRVQVPLGPARKAVAVPASALRKGPSGDFVFVLAPDQTGKIRARMRAVQSGAMLGDEIFIQEGLSAGEQVAASGSFKLRESALVAISTNAEVFANGIH